MRAVIQRTNSLATVKVNNNIVGSINNGLIVYLGIEDSDNDEDIVWLANKIASLRIFSDEEGKMNLSVKDTFGSLLIISQFTLYASTKKGNRPSFMRSANPEYAKRLYESFIAYVKSNHQLNVEQGIFAADMSVSYTNDGPVTIIIDSKNKE